MPEGQVIGRVSVKVLPDTDDFRRKLKKKLEAIEDSLVVKIPTALDITGAMKDMLREIQKINAENRVKDSRKIKLYTKIETSNMDEEITKALKKLNDKAANRKMKIPAEFEFRDSDLFQKVRDAEKRAQEASKGIKIDVDVDDTGSLQRALDRVDEELGRLREVRIDVDLDESSLQAVRSVLDRDLSKRRKIEVDIELNRQSARAFGTAMKALSGVRSVENIFRRLWDGFKNLDVAVPKIAALTLGVVGLGGAALASASNLFALSSSLAKIGYIGLALPGILGGVAIGLGATVAVFRDFNTVLPTVSTRLSKLQDQMSENFWAQAEGPMRRMIDTLLPEFAAGIEVTSTKLGTFFGTLSTSLKNALGGSLDGMFAGLNSSIEIFTMYTDDLANIIKVLGETGAAYLPRLAEWFGGLLEQFNDFISAAQADGSLTAWIESGISSARALGVILRETWEIFAGMGRAALAAGGSTTQSLADTLTKVSDVVNSPGFQKGMTDVFRAAHDAMSAISEKAGPAFKAFMVGLGDTLTKALPKVGETLGTAFKALFEFLGDPAVASGFLTMLDSIQKAVEKLAPILADSGKGFGLLMEAIGFVGESISNLIGGVFGPFQGVADNFAKKVRDIAAAFVPLTAKIGELLAFLAPVLVPVLTFISEILTGLVVGAINGVTTVIGGLILIGQGLVDFFKNVFAGEWGAAWSSLGTVVQGVWDVIVGAFEVFMNISILGILRKGVFMLLGQWKVGWNLLSTSLGAIWNGIKALVTAGWTGILNLLRAGLGVLKNLWTVTWNGIKTLAGVVWNGIKTLVTAGINGVKSVITTVINGIKTMWQTQWNAIKTVATVVWAAIKTAVTTGITAVKTAVTTGINNVKTSWQQGWDLVKAYVGTAWGKIKSAVVTGVENMMGVIRSIPGKITGAMANLGTLLFAAGASIVQGLIDGIQSMIGSVKSGFDKLTGMIPDWKGPAPRDKTLLVNAGVLIMDGFINGLESRYDAVRDSLRGLTHDVADTAFTAPSVGAMNLARGNAASGAAASGGASKVFNYYAAPGSSLGSEEDLFAASQRSRMVGW